MAKRINRAIELLEADQAIYYDGPHTGHVLTYEQGRTDAKTWADYINVGMEHGDFDMKGLSDYMRGLVDGGPTNSGHRTPTIIVEAPVNGIDGPNVAFNAWQFRQILARGVHGILLCQAESADAVKEFVRACRFPHHKAGADKIGPGKVVLTGLVLDTVGMAMLIPLDSTTSYGYIITAFVVMGLGMGATMMPVFTAALASLKSHDVARGSTLMNITQQVAASIGTALNAGSVIAPTSHGAGLVSVNVMLLPEVVIPDTLWPST